MAVWKIIAIWVLLTLGYPVATAVIAYKGVVFARRRGRRIFANAIVNITTNDFIALFATIMSLGTF